VKEQKGDGLLEENVRYVILFFIIWFVVSLLLGILLFKAALKTPLKWWFQIRVLVCTTKVPYTSSWSLIICIGTPYEQFDKKYWLTTNSFLHITKTFVILEMIWHTTQIT